MKERRKKNDAAGRDRRLITLAVLEGNKYIDEAFQDHKGEPRGTGARMLETVVESVIAEWKERER